MSTRSSLNHMREYRPEIASAVIVISISVLAMFFCGSCANIPLKDGGLAIGKDATVSIEDIGVTSINSRF
jgi:hypothetical protein